MANVTRWDPFQDMLSLREAMNQLMEESFVRPNAAQGGQNTMFDANALAGINDDEENRNADESPNSIF